MITSVHHVQLTNSKGVEASAKAFYCGVLGLAEIEKPESLRSRGGFWLRVGGRQVHVGVEDGVDRSATKAHVAYAVTDIASWRERLRRAGVAVTEGVPIPGCDRIEFRDPFGNRVELVEATPQTVVTAEQPRGDQDVARVGPEFIADQRRRLAETRARSEGVIRQMSDDDVNWRPNPQSNSATNLVLHVAGNLLQRYVATIAGGADARDRDAEFSLSARRTVGELLRLIEEAFGAADQVLARLRAEDLLLVTHVRGHPRTVLDVIATSTEHSAEHLGQVIYIAKARLGGRYRYLWTP